MKTTKLRDYSVYHKKIVDSLQDIRNKTVLEVNDNQKKSDKQQQVHHMKQQFHQQRIFKLDQSSFSGSVPDFKKVFISDYL